MAFVCDLCGGTSFLKSDGVFICNNCKTQYTLEEIKKLSNDAKRDSSYTQVDEKTQEKNLAKEGGESQQQKEQGIVRTVNTSIEEEEAILVKKNAEKKHVEEDSKQKTEKKKKIGIFGILGIVVTGIGFVTFVLGVILAYTIKDEAIGNILLLISGILELLIATILYKISIHKERFNCPVCGEKRVHHRTYLRTTENEKCNNVADTEIYTHHYRDTYVCNKCGETRVEMIKKSGGEYTQYSNGSIKDTRRAPKEF